MNLHPRIRLGRLVSPPFLSSFLYLASYLAERTAVLAHSGESRYSCSYMGKEFTTGSKAEYTKGSIVAKIDIRIVISILQVQIRIQPKTGAPVVGTMS